ncbi:zinc carboxypeptidase-like [Cydia fagiglandana]|uniref:zinc carboxypeptidase-like n=1 Tax=Cydia fagiglandana TaxID=1458189 RepID=UPI002FEDE6EB
MEFKLLLFVLLVAATACAEPKSYEGYKVYKVVPKTADEVESLLKVKISGVSEFWDESVDVNQIVKIMVSPAHEAEFIEILERDNIEATLVIDDVQRAIDDQIIPVSRRKGSGSSSGRPSGGSSVSGRPGSTSSSSSSGTGTTGSNGFLTYYALTSGSRRNRRTYQRNADTLFSFTWDRYHTLDTIYSWLDELAEAFPNIVKTVVMPGQSVEGREIKGIIIDYHPERTEKKIGMFEGGLHAREWISPATVTWIIKEFLVSDDPEVVALATSFEWHIFPVVNPDGYSYTFTDRRLWRKNRSRVNFTSCAASGVEDDLSNGVDLNRNFEFEWNTAGTSEDPCSNLFPGPSPASEPETQAIQQYVLNLRQQGEIIYYIAFHSYTQLIVVPYSHLDSNSVLQIPDYANMFEIAARAADALASRNGTTYRVGLSVDVMYLMSGTSFDWVKSTGVPVSYLIELRDVGEYGFLLPAEQIIPNNLEIMDALLEMDRATRDLNIYTRESSAGTVVTSMLLVAFGVIITVY